MSGTVQGKIDLTQFTVLVVDDTAVNLKIISAGLARTGMRVLLAQSGETAIERAQLAQPDIILLDVVMAGIDGFQTCRLLKADPQTRHIPVIFMTALSDTEHKVTGFAAGAVDYVTKPIQLDEVQARITTHLQLNALTRQFQTANNDLRQTVEELRATQHQLIEAEKMAALGNLVAGVAHEINTPVGIAMLAASTVADELNVLEKAYHAGTLKRSALDGFFETSHESVRLMLSNLQRAATLVQSFKQVAVDQANLEIRTFYVKPYLQETLFSLLPQLNRSPHRIELCGDDKIAMTSYPGALSQVVTNLVINSLAHAFDDGETGQMLFEIRRQAGRVEIRFSDNGCGMPEAVRERIFEPFFTTARGRGGTGLGLHIVYNLITQKMGGTIQCNSTLGVGTTFLLDLPAVVTATD